MRGRFTIYLSFQYSISCSLMIRSSFAAINSLLRELNCSCMSSLDSLGTLKRRLRSIYCYNLDYKVLISMLSFRFYLDPCVLRLLARSFALCSRCH